MNLQEFYTDIDNLYLWMDDIYKIECPDKCNDCCKQDIIWMLVPELARFNTMKKPRVLKYGCPYRTRHGCSVYEYRPLVCRSYGAAQLLQHVENIRMLEVKIEDRRQILAGPGVCVKYMPSSSCNLLELNQIYECYLSLAKKWGLVAIGACSDEVLQASQESIMKNMQNYEKRHNIYARDGVLNYLK